MLSVTLSAFGPLAAYLSIHMPTISPTWTVRPVSSRTSLAAAASGCSSGPQKPPGMSQSPRQGSCARRTSSSRPSRVTSAPAHGLASSQWLVSQAAHVTGGGAGRGAPQ